MYTADELPIYAIDLSNNNSGTNGGNHGGNNGGNHGGNNANNTTSTTIGTMTPLVAMPDSMSRKTGECYYRSPLVFDDPYPTPTLT